MPDKVVDASVLAAWLFRESRAEEAFRLIQGSNLYAPSLLAYELTSAARTKVLRYPEHHQQLRIALSMGLALPIRWTEVDHLAVLRLSLDTGLTTYDAAYLYLARSLGLPLVTFDERVQAALQGQI